MRLDGKFCNEPSGKYEPISERVAKALGIRFSGNQIARPSKGGSRFECAMITDEERL